MTDLTTLLLENRPLLAVLVSVVGTAFILAFHSRPNVREGWTVVTALAKFAIVASMLPAVLAGETFEVTVTTFLPGIELALRADSLGMLFAFLASGLWIITSFYSIGYMRGLSEPNQTRYFAAFAMSLSATMGIAFAANLVTIFLFYELLSVATYPLVAHDEDDKARSAGRKYLAYTMFGGGVLVLAGTVVVYWLTGLAGIATVSFVGGGIPALAQAASSDPLMAQIAFLLLGIGFGVKAGLMPLHQWLPEAMVAPTPVSGLLHAVAVVKSGAFGVSRVVLDVFGPELVYDLGVGVWIAALAAFTLTAASIIALRKDHLKQRLAYSTVSQLSYIVLGLGLFGWYGLVGALLHIPAHAFMKLTLFFCAGAIHVETHTDYISEMAGIGKRMPVTMVAFTVAAAGMAGMPLLAGFVSKYYMLIGGVQMGAELTPIGYYLAGALLLSGVLNIGYFWPVVYTAFFESEDDHDAKPLVDFPYGGERAATVERARADGGREGVDDATDDSAQDDETEGSAGSDEPEPEEIVQRPSFDAPDRDFSEPAERVDTGDYAVDANPSDADVSYGMRDGDADNEHPGDRPDVDADDHSGHDHHGGPPAGGWERIAARAALRGRESTWFMLAPILVAMGLAVALGVVPDRIVFLELIELVVETRGVSP